MIYTKTVFSHPSARPKPVFSTLRRAFVMIVIVRADIPAPLFYTCARPKPVQNLFTPCTTELPNIYNTHKNLQINKRTPVLIMHAPKLSETTSPRAPFRNITTYNI